MTKVPSALHAASPGKAPPGISLRCMSLTITWRSASGVPAASVTRHDTDASFARASAWCSSTPNLPALYCVLGGLGSAFFRPPLRSLDPHPSSSRLVHYALGHVAMIDDCPIHRPTRATNENPFGVVQVDAPASLSNVPDLACCTLSPHIPQILCYSCGGRGTVRFLHPPN